MSQIKLGKYKHYHGKEYEVIGIAKHKETLEEIVVYRALYKSPESGECELWVCPVNSFLGRATDPSGKKVPRFEFVGKK